MAKRDLRKQEANLIWGPFFHSPEYTIPPHPARANDAENNSDGTFEVEGLSESLEDLVGTFDQRVSQCFKDMGEDTEDLAPVQIRTQDEIMSESQIWWTITGNFGTMPPLDFSKTQTRELQLPALNLQPRKEVLSLKNHLVICNNILFLFLSSVKTKYFQDGSDPGIDVSDDEELREVLDMHQLVYQQGPPSDSPPQTAEQVIEEIDQMLQSCDFSGSVMTDRTMESIDSMYSSMRSPLHSSHSEMDAKFKQAVSITACPEYLKSLTCSKLIALNAEMEQLIQVYNESLVEQLAHRDELEYEKEMKNTFISLLLSIQNRRRQFNNDRKRKALRFDNSQLPQVFLGLCCFNFIK
ncbi:unnamed protein product [Dracunculus medinensis]|uniref:FEZ-like protein n=1 Tax=Dracunculus medinensis TaxID=318479 RepID=A0A0N4UFK4_DRAME|nr:unnamed protein product [Dracunculus medinensis]